MSVVAELKTKLKSSREDGLKGFSSVWSSRSRPVPISGAGLVLFAASFLAFGALVGGGLASFAAGQLWQGVERWQTLLTGAIALFLGWTAWRGVQISVAASRADTEAQLAEMRRQFRHQMMVVTARDRLGVANAIVLPLSSAKSIATQAQVARDTPHNERRPVVWQRRADRMMEHAKAMKDWLEAGSSQVVVAQLPIRRRGDIEGLISFVETFHSGVVQLDGLLPKETGDNDDSFLELIVNYAGRVEKALSAAKAEVDDWVPSEEGPHRG